MNGSDGESTLREGMTAFRERAGTGADCPSADLLWKSAGEQLPAEEENTVLMHTAACAECAGAWRLAREMLALEGHVATPTEPVPVTPEARSGSGWWYGLAAAAVVVTAIGLWSVVALREPGASAPVERAEEEPDLVSLTPPERPLSRAACVLRWSGAPEGSTYDVRVTTEQLEPLSRAFGLKTAEYLLEPEKLEGLSPGDAILWRVTARLPEGGMVASPTFRNLVE